MPVIYPDLFKRDNLEFVQGLDKELKLIRSKITFLKKCLLKYTNFNNSQISIEKVL